MEDLINFAAGLPGQIVIGLTTAAVQFLLIVSFRYVWNRLANRRTIYGSGPWANRRFLVLLSFFVVSVGVVFLILATGRSNSVTVLFVSVVFLFLVVFRELSSFWHFGFNYIEKSISQDTYQRAFRTCRSDFRILGTNAFSFSEQHEFENMLKRIRDSGGTVVLMLAHPDSNGLVDAAKSRGCSESLYCRQGKYSLGRIFNLADRLSLKIDIRLYQAESMHDLPIFRSMFLDHRQCVSSIAVYGREDHGANFPQIVAKAPTDSRSSTIYEILNRYFYRMWYNSTEPTSDEIRTFQDFYLQSMANQSILSELRQ